MALTYSQSAALMVDPDFRGRVKVSCLTFANSIQNELPSVPAHNARLRWANQCFQNADMTATQVQPPTVMDPAVQDTGSTISDTALQGAVETTVNKLI